MEKVVVVVKKNRPSRVVGRGMAWEILQNKSQAMPKNAIKTKRS